jgi:hypothetical protein
VISTRRANAIFPVDIISNVMLENGHCWFAFRVACYLSADAFWPSGR